MQSLFGESYQKESIKATAGCRAKQERIEKYVSTFSRLNEDQGSQEIRIMCHKYKGQQKGQDKGPENGLFGETIRM